MGKMLRFLLWLVGGLVLILVVAAIVLPLIIDPNDYRDEIATLVKDKTGRDLTLDGELSLSVFPWLGVEVGHAALGNAPGFGDAPFAEIDEARVSVKLLPLLRKEIRMSTLELDGLRLNLAKDESGRTNWDDLAGAAAAGPPAGTETPESQAPAAGKGPALAGLAIGGVKVEDATLTFADAQAGSRLEVKDIELALGEIRPGQPVRFELGFEMDMQGEPEARPIEAEFGLAGLLTVSDDFQRVQVADFKAELEAEGEGLPEDGAGLSLQTDLDVDLEKQTLSMPKLLLKLADLEARGSLSGTGITSGQPAFEGSLAIEEFAPRALLASLGQPVPETADDKVLQKFSADLAFKAGSDHLNAERLEAVLDDSTLTGQASVANFATPRIRFGMELDAIDVDRYLPPPKEGQSAQVATPAEATAAGAGALPVETLRKLDVDGTIRMGKVKVANLQAADISVKVTGKDGVLNVDPASAALYQGAYQGKVTLDVRGKQPKVAVDERLNGIQAGPLLKDLTGKDRITGAADLAAKLTFKGIEPDAVKKTLNGTMNFAFRDGAVKGINVAQLIRVAQARIKGQPVPPETGPNQTDFTELTGSAKVTNGVVRNDDLLAKSPLLRVSGKGTASLPAETLDYVLTTKIVGSLEGQGGAGLDELKGVAIPIRISGTFAEPKYAVQLDEVLKERAKQEVEKQIEKKLGDKLPEGVGGALKGLLGR